MIYKMKAFDLFGFQVEIDEVATKEWYDKQKNGAANVEIAGTL